ncbi:hypothetical protein [Streptomyces malaysiensis]
MRWINSRQQTRDHAGQRNICAACGHDGTSRDPLINNTDGFRVHRSHTTDQRHGLYGTAQ